MLYILRPHHTTMPGPNKGKERPKKSRTADVVTREVTINLHKRVHGIAFTKRAPRAVKEITQFAKKLMGTEDVRVEVQLNKYVWSQGVRNVPHRVRVRLQRKRNEDEEATDKLYTLVSYIPVATTKGLLNKTIEDEAQ